MARSSGVPAPVVLVYAGAAALALFAFAVVFRLVYVAVKKDRPDRERAANVLPDEPPRLFGNGPARPEPAAPPPFAVDPKAKAAGRTAWLTELTPFAYRAGPWKLGIGTRGDDGTSPIVVQSNAYPYGISMHPPQTGEGSCRVSFAPGGEFRRLRGWVGIQDYEFDPHGPVVFGVWGDGRPLWESAPIGKSGAAAEFDIDVTGVKVLTLDTRMDSGRHHAANAVWLDPRLER